MMIKNSKKHKVLTGDGPPPKKLGEIGDLYFDSWDDDSLEYYVKVGKKEWELRGTLVEPSDDCESGDVLKYNQADNKWKCEEDLVDDADADPVNELQTLSRSGSDVTLSQSDETVSIDDADADPANELQSIRITTKIITGEGEPLYDLQPESQPGQFVTGSITCDAGKATGFQILWVQSNGTPVIKDLLFSGATATFTIANAHLEESAEVNVMVICMELILVNP